MKSHLYSLAIVSCVCGFCLGTVAHGADYYVDGVSGLDRPGRGTQQLPWATINYALDHVNGAAASPHRVLVAGGIYVENVVCDPYESLFGGYDPVTWARDPASFETTINGNQLSSAVVLADRSTIDGFTVTNGKRELGGGIYCSHVTATISNCRIALNQSTAEQGGSAIYAKGGLVRIIASSVFQNKGSAVAVDSGTLMFEDNLIAESTGIQFGSGGGCGVYAKNATVNLSGDSIVRNAAEGIYLQTSSLEAVDCVIGDNQKDGIFQSWSSQSASTTLRGCVVSGNGKATYNGGGLSTDGPNVVVERCVFSQNASTFRGGAIRDEGADTWILDSVFTGNWTGWNQGCFLAGRAKTLKNNFFVNNNAVVVNHWCGGGFPFTAINNSVLYNSAGYQFECIVRDGQITLANDLLWGNGDDLVLENENQSISFCNIEDGDFNGKSGNVSVAPDFVGEVAAGVITELAYDADQCRSVITDLGATFSTGALARCFLWVNDTAFYIRFNTAAEITVYGDVRKAASEGATFTVQDYRLQQGSLCIDAGTGSGSPDHDFEGDRRPLNGGRGLLVDIGADEFNPEGSPNLPPTAPTVMGTLAIAITAPSADPDGGPVRYTVTWESDTDDMIVHQGCVSVRGVLCDVLTETTFIKPAQTWTVTVTPSDVSQEGPAARVVLSTGP
jgi:hypothetical protein